MRDRLIYYLLILCLFGGFIVLIGTTGASDFELIGLKALIIRSIVGLVLLVIGAVGIKKGGYGLYD